VRDAMRVSLVSITMCYLSMLVWWKTRCYPSLLLLTSSVPTLLIQWPLWVFAGCKLYRPLMVLGQPVVQVHGMALSRSVISIQVLVCHPCGPPPHAIGTSHAVILSGHR
jgi:hypothetical protein